MDLKLHVLVVWRITYDSHRKEADECKANDDGIRFVGAGLHSPIPWEGLVNHSATLSFRGEPLYDSTACLRAWGYGPSEICSRHAMITFLDVARTDSRCGLRAFNQLVKLGSVRRT